VTEWQSIKTAPRPSIRVYSWLKTERLLLWGQPAEGIEWPLIGQAEIYDNNPQAIRWFSEECYEDNGMVMRLDIRPTHWMPLPPGP
jgi:hypothetical protein